MKYPLISDTFNKLREQGIIKEELGEYGNPIQVKSGI